jgi:hypothetical protein
MATARASSTVSRSPLHREIKENLATANVISLAFRCAVGGSSRSEAAVTTLAGKRERAQSRRYALNERKAPSPRRTMAPAMIAPMFWPNPPAIAANAVGKSISCKATENGKPAEDGHKHRPSVGPAIVNAHNGKPSDEQEDTRHEDKRWVAGNLFRQRGERANVQQHGGSDYDKGGADQAGDRFRGFHPIGLRSGHINLLLPSPVAVSRSTSGITKIPR